MKFRVLLFTLACSVTLLNGWSISIQPAVGQSINQQLSSQKFNDFPTVARADYVFGCMAVNGQGRDVLHKCACSIDTIASIVPYEKYVQAETILSMRLVGGEKTAMFRSSPLAEAHVAVLKRAQAEAEIICFLDRQIDRSK